MYLGLEGSRNGCPMDGFPPAEQENFWELSHEHILLSKKNNSVCHSQGVWRSKQKPRGRLWWAHRYKPRAVLDGRLMREIRRERFQFEGPDKCTVNRMWWQTAFGKKKRKAEITSKLGPSRIEQKCVYIYFLILRKGTTSLGDGGKMWEQWIHLLLFLL